MKVTIRRLEVADAVISWKWRNDPEIWKLTGRNWNGFVSKETEQKWIALVTKRNNEKRFAICVNTEEKYIGNIQLTNINDDEAIFHIFIGNKEYWGKGVATIATKQILEYAICNLKLKKISLYVKKENLSAIKVYERVGFKLITENKTDYFMTYFDE